MDKSILKDEPLLIRPLSLDDFIGQKELVEMLDIYIKAANNRNEALDHVLLYGPPGLGKTTLANIIANELNSNIKVINGPSIEKTGDLLAVLTSLEFKDVLFIDEIHRLPKFIEEVLYSAMEDYYIDIIIGQDSETRSIRIELPHFTLVAATTRFGDLTSPLRDRFGVVSKLKYYDVSELHSIINRTSKVFSTNIDEDSINNLAIRSRGTPRIANTLFKRVRDFSQVLSNGSITNDITNLALSKLGINSKGLNETDILYLEVLINNFNGGPVGVDTLATSIYEEVSTLEDVYEPYLMNEGYINRTSRGRIATNKAYEMLKIRKDI